MRRSARTTTEPGLASKARAEERAQKRAPKRKRCCLSFDRASRAQREIRFRFESIGRFGEERLSTGGGTRGAGVFDMVHARAEARVCALARLRSLARTLTTRALCHKFLHTAFIHAAVSGER